MGMTTRGAEFTVVANTFGLAAANATVSGNLSSSDTVQSGEVQKLQMEISREKGFYPNTFTVKKGIPVELDINAKIQLTGCMGTMVLPDYNIAHVLKLGNTKLKFTPTRTGTNWFTCSMGSRIGKFIVE